MAERFVVDFQKARVTETEDGLLTSLGMQLAHRYALRWVNDNARDLELEREYPELAGLFYDIRVDPELAREHALPED